MALTKEKKGELILKFGKNQTDTGSSKAQIALLTQRIQELTNHFHAHVKDHHSRRGLLKMVGQRRRLLRYVQTTDLEGYRELITALGIRG